MRRFTLSALVALTVLGFTLADPMLASAQDAAAAPIPVFMPPLSAYAPVPPPPCPVVLVSAPVCQPACAPVCTPPATVCRPACPAPAPVRAHQRIERFHERTARREHEVRCRR